MAGSKEKVTPIYDTANCTWNIMDANRACLFFGSIDGLEQWLVDNDDEYEEAA